MSVIPSYCSKEVYNKENLFNSLNYDVAAKKRKKDMLNSKTKTQCKPFVVNLRRKLKIIMIGFWQGNKSHLTCLASAFMLTVSFTEVTRIFALRNLAVHFMSEINVFFTVVFISQLLVGVFFSLLVTYI